jgi:hypothetical protein
MDLPARVLRLSGLTHGELLYSFSPISRDMIPMIQKLVNRIYINYLLF